jgi:tetratricopeptide (TPR) repeat protein
MSLTNKYLFEAMDAYPYDLTQVIESLNYALSHDDKNPMALCLMGRVYAEQLGFYEEAITYFEKAINSEIYAFKVYPYYIDVLLKMEDFDKACVLIEFAMTLKGFDKSVLYAKKSLLHEYKCEYKSAVEYIKKAKNHTYEADCMDALELIHKRIKSKMPKIKKKVEPKNEE